MRAKSTLVDVYLQTRRCRAPVMSPCLHGRLFGSAGSQSVYSRQTRPSRLRPLSYRSEDFPSVRMCRRQRRRRRPFHSRRSSRNSRDAICEETLSFRWDRNSWWIGKDESGETADRADSLSRPTVARRRYLIKKCNALGIGARKLVSLFGRVLPYSLNFLSEKWRIREIFFSSFF